MEDILQPNRIIKTRDFYYAVFDPRHWGRKLSETCNDPDISKQRVLESWQASKLGSEGGIRTADSGDGWLTIQDKYS
jgi:hypothetical protein